MVSMRVVIATPLYPPEIGGPATDAAALVVCLKQQGIEAAVCAFRAVRPYPPLVRHIVYGFRLMKVARRANSIVAFDTVSVGFPAALVAWFMNIPFVVRVPGDYAWEQGVQRFGVRDSIDVFQEKRYGLTVELLRKVQKFVVVRAVLVLAPSEYFKKIIAGWGVRPERLQRIYLGLDFTDKIVAPLERPEGSVMVSIGRFVPWKGFSVLLEILAALPEWQLVLVGDGPQRTELQTKVRTLGVENRVLFTGAVSHAEVLGWCVAADAFVLNTEFESFSFQVLEAMAVGVPVITTRVGSLPELIEDGVEGILCTPNDSDALLRAIKSTVADSETWKRRTEAAQKKAKTFSIGASATAFAESLKHICA